MRVPCVPKAGRLAVTITAATLPVRMVGAADVDAEPLQHRLQRLLGERDVVERVAGAVEADHQAVADQLVLPHALDVGEILDARRRRTRQADRAGRRRDADEGQRRDRRGKRTLSASSSPLLPNESDCTSYHANAMPAAPSDQVTEMSRDYFSARGRAMRLDAVRPANFAGHLPAVNHTGPPLPVSRDASLVPVTKACVMRIYGSNATARVANASAPRARGVRRHSPSMAKSDAPKSTQPAASLAPSAASMRCSRCRVEDDRPSGGAARSSAAAPRSTPSMSSSSGSLAARSSRRPCAG